MPKASKLKAAAKAAPAKKRAAKIYSKGDIKPPKPVKKIDKRGTPKGKGTIKTKGGGKIGNPPHQRTAELIKLANDLSAYGLPHWAIAEMMGISEDTLERHYAKELAIGPHRMNARAANMVAKGVLAGDKDYVRFWLARRGGPAWTNKQALEHSGPRGKPIEHRDMSGLSDAQLEALAALERDDDD